MAAYHWALHNHLTTYKNQIQFSLCFYMTLSEDNSFDLCTYSKDAFSKEKYTKDTECKYQVGNITNQKNDK